MTCLDITLLKFLPNFPGANELNYCFAVLSTGIKSNNRMQQLQDMTMVCYDKVLQQVRNGEQVSTQQLLNMFVPC